MSNPISTPAIPPYFDVLFARLQEDDPGATTAFGRHVHWGYWTDPARASGSPEDYARAAERLSNLVCAAAGIKDGQRILDAGCGFGGTLASLNERFSNLELVGLNIDPRQLDRASRIVQPRNGNRIFFVQGDACALDVKPGSFDVILSVESIFHFADRGEFFKGAVRALTPGGRLALSDFVPPEKALPLLRTFDPATDPATCHTYGRINVLCSLDAYRKLGQQTGLELVQADDVTNGIMPTYPFLRREMKSWPDPNDARLFDRATSQLETACRSRLLTYSILGFRKRAASLSRAA